MNPRTPNLVLRLFAVLVPVLVIFGAALFLVPKLNNVVAVGQTQTGTTADSNSGNPSTGAETEGTSGETAREAEKTEKTAAEEPPEEVAAQDRAAEKKIEERAAEKKAKEKAAAEKRAAERAAARKKAEEAARPAPPSDPTMSLTVPRLGLYGDTVRNSSSVADLHRGAIKVPVTGFPWEGEGGVNTYIAGHRVGFAGTESYYQFYELPAMQQGDAVYLTDANGTTYEYRVSEIFAVSPSENWVTAPIPGREMVTLQTCTESLTDWWTLGPNLYNSTPSSGRLVVRADKVAIDYPG